jgi:hypothetical protein
MGMTRKIINEQNTRCVTTSGGRLGAGLMAGSQGHKDIFSLKISREY